MSFGEEYEAALYAQVAKEKVVRWYVSRISGDTAEIEAIVEEKGVGNSAIIYEAKENRPPTIGCEHNGHNHFASVSHL
eukprot:gene29584-38150_t